MLEDGSPLLCPALPRTASKCSPLQVIRCRRLDTKTNSPSTIPNALLPKVGGEALGAHRLVGEPIQKHLSSTKCSINHPPTMSVNVDCLAVKKINQK